MTDLRKGIIEHRQRWVIDADVSKYFDTIPFSHLRSFLDLRIKDGVVRRMIDKWLNAGVLEAGTVHRPVAGTPQGGVISPLISNVFLHHVLDLWFEQVVKPRLHGECQLVRFADDFVLSFEDRLSGKRVLDVLGKRLGRFGLKLHETKTRYVDFRRTRPYGRHWMASATTFDFLGFTHVWGRSRRGKDVVRQITAKGRFARALKSVHDWCKRHRHLPIIAQREHLALMIRGHCAYYGLVGERQTIGVVPLPGHSNLAEVACSPQPPSAYELGPDECTAQAIPLAFSTDRASMARSLQRICQVRNRVREFRSLGSVRGGAQQCPRLLGRGQPVGNLRIGSRLDYQHVAQQDVKRHVPGPARAPGEHVINRQRAPVG